jgi:hypothetical protein
LIVPILDGLDEILEGVRGAAVSRINDALRPGEQLVTTCRSQQYRDAVRPEGGIEATLRGAAAVELRPLDTDAVRDYLRDDAAGPVARARWDPVFEALGADSPTTEATGWPLMVGLARAIYSPRPGELAGTLPDPAKLCSPALADRAGRSAAAPRLRRTAGSARPGRPGTGPGGPGAEAERGLQRLTVRIGQPVQVIQQRLAQLLQSGERQLHLGLDAYGTDDPAARRAHANVVQQRRLAHPRLADQHQRLALARPDSIDQPV